MGVRKIEYPRSLATSSMLRMYNVLQDWDDTKFLNIFKSFEVSNKILEKQDIFDLYVVDEDDWWDNISYRFYGTPYFWWVLTLVNKTENPFESLEPGEEIRILRKEYTHILLDNIREISRL